jgi:hypothetical protein
MIGLRVAVVVALLLGVGGFLAWPKIRAAIDPDSGTTLLMPTKAGDLPKADAAEVMAGIDPGPVAAFRTTVSAVYGVRGTSDGPVMVVGGLFSQPAADDSGDAVDGVILGCRAAACTPATGAWSRHHAPSTAP